MQEKKSYKVYLIFFVLILVYLVFAIQYSPIFEKLGSDKEVFQYIGMLIKNNKYPYTDAFDHKPPIIYLVNYLGCLFTPNSTWGIFIILNFMGFFSALLVYKAALNRFQTFILPMLICVAFFCVNNSNIILQEGNLTRQIAAFLTIWVIFLIFTNKRTKIKSILIGFIIGIIFFTQQNEVLGGVILSGYYLMFKKNFSFNTLKSILENITFFTLGLLIPFIGTLLIVNHWDNYGDFINQVFLFNFDNYIEDKSFITKIAAVVYRFATIAYLNKVLLIIILLTPVSLLLSKIDEKKWHIDPKFIVLFTALIFQIISTSISGKTYGHYFLMFVPYIIFMFIFSFYEKRTNYKNFLLIALVGVLIYHSVSTLSYHKPNNSLLEGLTKEVISVKNTEGQFYSLNGRYLRVNFNLNITAPSKHIYTHFMNEEVGKEIIEDLRINKTKYILFDIREDHIIPESLKSFITLNYKETMIHKDHILFKRK
ncbi:hypothetical protein [Flavivirga eckloniae]|uniref:Glycosyltransferase RgtA/B/C/D-like domain-containing protein n=1 Tax=Flavivirga eckloniae TaxID=1803846 RepID=A0A2K9PPG2_9FLAO|nr:hypothetical protein [Flavivirga eckloniae]AUP78939.1 hypothetical protein C1H87_09595 [Flavivirga eckloniae]